MRDKDDHDQLDDLDLLLDASLATYGNPPGDGLEDRLLRTVRKRLVSENAPRRLRWLAWSAALASAACLLGFVLFSPKLSIRPANSTPQARTEEKPRSGDSTIAGIPAPAAGNRIAPGPHKGIGARANPPAFTQTAKAEPLPKLDVFPTPAPLDQRVEALAFFIRRAPANEVKELLEKRAQAEAPLAFKELEIPPLEPLDEGGK